MDRRLVIGVGVAFVVIFALSLALMLRSGEEVVEIVDEVMPVHALSQIEVEDVGGSRDTIVVERQDDQWRLVRPVEGPASVELIERFQTLFGGGIALQKVGDVREDEFYSLDGASVRRISLYSGEEDAPKVRLYVGRQEEIAGVGGHRTYVRREQGGAVYAADAAFGDLVRTPVTGWRNRWIVSLAPERIQEVKVEHQDGEVLDLIRREGGQWAFGDNERDVDQERVAELTRRVANLTARGFGDVAPSVWQSAGATSVIRVMMLDRVEHVLEIQRWESGTEVRYLARVEGEQVTYELDEGDGVVLGYRAVDLVDRSILGVTSGALSELKLEGRYHLQRGSEGWVRAGHPGVGVDQEGAGRLAETVAGLRATAWIGEDVAPSVGPFDRIGPIQVGVDGHSTTLEIGPLVEGTRDRYARYSEREGVFILDRSTIERLTQSFESLTLQGE